MLSLALLILASVWTPWSNAQTIVVDYYPLVGDNATIDGHINGVANPTEYRLAIVNEVFGTFWSKPSSIQPWVPLSSNALFRGIFITGGGGGIGTIEDMAKISLKLPSRIASLNMGDSKSRIKDSTWAVAYGLCILGFSTEEKKELGVKPTVSQISGKIFDWLKQFLP